MPKCCVSALVLAVRRGFASTTTMLAAPWPWTDSACRRASARTFFGRSMAWLRGSDRRPCRRRGTAAPSGAVTGAAGALLLVELLARAVDFRTVLGVCVPAWRFAAASAPCAAACRRAARDRRSRPSSSTEPAACRLERRDIQLHHAFSFFSRRQPQRLVACPERAGHRRILRQLPLHRVADQIQPPLAPGTAPSTRIRPRSTSVLHDAQVLRRDALVAHVAGHLLALEGLARVLAPTGRTDASGARPTRRAWRADRRSSSASCRRRSPCPIVVPVTSTNWPATKWSAVISAPTGIRLPRTTRNSASLRFGSTLATAKLAALRLAQTFLTLALPDAELQRGIAVLLVRPMGDDLAVVQLQHGDRDVLPGVREDAGHARPSVQSRLNASCVPLGGLPTARRALMA